MSRDLNPVSPAETWNTDSCQVTRTGFGVAAVCVGPRLAASLLGRLDSGPGNPGRVTWHRTATERRRKPQCHHRTT